MMKRLSPVGGLLVVVAGLGVIGYLVSMFVRASRK
jgi:hypothetical protein